MGIVIQVFIKKNGMSWKDFDFLELFFFVNIVLNRTQCNKVFDSLKDLAI